MALLGGAVMLTFGVQVGATGLGVTTTVGATGLKVHVGATGLGVTTTYLGAATGPGVGGVVDGQSVATI